MQFFFQNVRNEILEMFKCNLKITRVAFWINSKRSNRDKSNKLMIFLFCHCCLSFLWCRYWRSLMPWNSTSWSRLKSAIQIQLALYPWDPFLIVLVIALKNNILRFCSKLSIDFKTCCLLFSSRTPLPTRLAVLEIFAYPRNKCVICGSELNL